ncbi:MAG: type IV toxin-antitoxin system AbiEi family antitoxin domain-containing protein [Pirellulales bacterium]
MQRYRPTKTALRRLVAAAQNQGGYFTTRQAREIGYSHTHLNYHVRAHNFQRVDHGLYRLPEIPLAEHDDLIRLSFWSRDRNDEPQAVFSHQTALAIQGLSDLMPARIHLTVPRLFRKHAPRGTVIHRSSLHRSDVEQREGFKVTTALRTLIDVAADETVAPEQLERAVSEALEQGLVRESKLRAAANDFQVAERLRPVLAGGQ